MCLKKFQLWHFWLMFISNFQPKMSINLCKHLKNLVAFILENREGNGTPVQYSCLENPMDEEPSGLQSMGSLRVGHNWAISLSLFTFVHWKRKRQPTPVFLPGESHGRRTLVGYSPRGRKESDMTERLHFHFHVESYNICFFVTGCFHIAYCFQGSSMF